MYNDAISIISNPKISREDIIATRAIHKCLRPKPFNKMTRESVEMPRVEQPIPKAPQNTYEAGVAKNQSAQSHGQDQLISKCWLKYLRFKPSKKIEAYFLIITRQKKCPISKR